MDRQQRERVESVLAYDENTADDMMDIQTQTTRANVSVDVVILYLRLQDDLLHLAEDLFTIDIVIGVAMLLNLLIAPLVGVTLAILLIKSEIDPALADSVLLTTATDVVGYTAVLGLGHYYFLS